MTISFSGLASGLDTSTWVAELVKAKQTKVTSLKNELSSIKTIKNTVSSTKTAFTSLRTALEKFTDAKFGGNFDLFTKNSAKSSDTNIFTVTADSNAARQSYDIIVNQLATCTKATSMNPASALADDNTTLKSLGVTEGSFSVYVDGVKTSINIVEDTTLGDLKQDLAGAGITMSNDTDDLIKLEATNGTSSINIGATNDKSNLMSLFSLTRQDDGTYKSMNAMYKASTSSKLTDADAGVAQQITQGTFTIGDAEFTIDENTTLSSIISAINNNSKAQANAHWDDTNGKLIINSTAEGASYINIEAGTSNFTDVMGFTSSQWDAEGNVVSSTLLNNAQELGQNALLSINGTNITSTSNKVTSDVSRLAGITIDLNKVSEEDDNGVKKSTKLSVEQDSTELINAVKSFIEEYNNTMSKIDEVTANGADLQRETTLSSFKNTMRTFATSRNDTNGGDYMLLSQIGISTGKADSSNLSTDTDKLQLDEEALKKALEENPESVKALLAGDDGVLSHIEDSVEQMLQATTGFFDVKTSTLDSDIKKMEEKITKQQTKINSYQKQLENKFSQMELVISKMQQNYSSFLG